MGMGVGFVAIVTTSVMLLPLGDPTPPADPLPLTVNSAVVINSGIPECPEPPKGGFYWRFADVPLAVKQRPSVCWAYANLVGRSQTTVHTNVIPLRESAVPAQAPQAPLPTFKKLLEQR